MKFSKLLLQYIVLTSYEFHGDWPHCYKTIHKEVSAIVHAYRQVYASENNGRFVRHKNQRDALIQFANMLVDVQQICSWPIPVNRTETSRQFLCNKCLNFFFTLVAYRWLGVG